MRVKLCLCILLIGLLCPAQLALATTEGAQTCAEGLVPDCAGECGGDKVFDDCGVCDGGNQDKDDCDVCFGNNQDKDDCGICFGTNQDKDECGVCFGENQGKDECGVCFGYNQAQDACGVCFGDGNSCRCTQVTGVWLGDVGQISAGQIYQPSQNSPACLQQEVNTAINFCASRDFSHLPFGPYLLDDCVVGGYFGGNPALTGGVKSPFPLSHSNGLICYISDGEGCSPQTFSFLVDKDCKTPTQCGIVDQAYLRWISSPISLLWEEGTDIEAMKSVAKFKLDPTNDASWTIWKASEKTPLLVYDPENTGRVTGAHQLFGNWSFGGQKVASLSAFGTNPAAAPWENGYEALGTLDQDGDQILSGSELDSIKLWFDRNQNAVAEASELQSLKAAGVTRLYTVANRTDTQTGSIYADIGFERTVDGKTVKGASVDWYGEASNSKYELLLTEALLKNAKEAIEKELKNAESNIIKRNKDVTIAELSLDKNVRGIWKWEAVEALADEGFTPSGFLSFRDIGDGSITGHSIASVTLTKKAPMEGSLVDIIAFNGERKSGSSGTLITFGSESDAQAIESSATMVDGKLAGKTVASVTLSNGKRETVTYHWNATRIAALDRSQLEKQLEKRE